MVVRGVEESLDDEEGGLPPFLGPENFLAVVQADSRVLVDAAVGVDAPLVLATPADLLEVSEEVPDRGWSRAEVTALFVWSFRSMAAVQGGGSTEGGPGQGGAVQAMRAPPALPTLT